MTDVAGYFYFMILTELQTNGIFLWAPHLLLHAQPSEENDGMDPGVFLTQVTLNCHLLFFFFTILLW